MQCSKDCACDEFIIRPSVAVDGERCWCTHLKTDHMKIMTSTQIKKPLDQLKSSVPYKEPIFKTGTMLSSIRDDVAWYPAKPPGHTSISWNGTPEVNSKYYYLSPELEVREKEHEVKEETKVAHAPKKGMSKGGNKPVPTNNQSEISKLDFRVGKIVSVNKHEQADKLYIEMIDIGEEQPRQILSGLVPFITADQLNGSMCIVVCNLKPSKLAGIMSYGMILAGSDSEKKVVELVTPPIKSRIGERVVLINDDFSGTKPTEVINAQKKNHAWQQCVTDLRVNSIGIACYKQDAFKTSAGDCTCATVRNGPIS